MLSRHTIEFSNTAGHRRILTLACSMLLVASASGASELAPRLVGTDIDSDTVTSGVASTKTGTEIERFCSNIADAARDRRYVMQTQELMALQKEVDERIKMLEEKRVEYEEWLKRREEFLESASDSVVKIYSGMRPDAAAERLAELDAVLAAGILMKLDARKAGVILNEMDHKAAAMLTGVMASASRRSDPT